MKVNNFFSIIFPDFYISLSRTEVPLSDPLGYSSWNPGNSDIFSIYYIVCKVVEPRVNRGSKEDWGPWFTGRVSSC